MGAIEPKRLLSYAAVPPGSIGGRLNYTLSEKAVNINVLDKVREARAQVLDKYSPDTLGLKQPQWTAEVALRSSKHNPGYSDLKLCNSLRPDLLNKSDIRTYQGTTYVDDNTTYHAFDRGEVTTGWNFSTAVDPKSLQQIALHTQKAGQPTQASGAAPQHVSLHAREQQFLDAQRRQKAEMRDSGKCIFGATSTFSLAPHRKPKLKATKADLQAVENLPDDVTLKQHVEEVLIDTTPIDPQQAHDEAQDLGARLSTEE